MTPVSIMLMILGALIFLYLFIKLKIYKVFVYILEAIIDVFAAIFTIFD